jgi:hypothetical protein
LLVDGQAFERLDRGFGRILGLEIPLEDVDVVIDPLQALALDESLSRLVLTNRAGIRAMRSLRHLPKRTRKQYAIQL